MIDMIDVASVEWTSVIKQDSYGIHYNSPSNNKSMFSS